MVTVEVYLSGVGDLGIGGGFESSTMISTSFLMKVELASVRSEVRGVSGILAGLLTKEVSLVVVLSLVFSVTKVPSQAEVELVV